MSNMLPPHSQVALIQEMMALRKSILKSFDEINDEIAALVSKEGPFTCPDVCAVANKHLKHMNDLQFSDIANVLLLASLPEEQMIDFGYYTHLN